MGNNNQQNSWQTATNPQQNGSWQGGALGNVFGQTGGTNAQGLFGGFGRPQQGTPPFVSNPPVQNTAFQNMWNQRQPGFGGTGANSGGTPHTPPQLQQRTPQQLMQLFQQYQQNGGGGGTPPGGYGTPNSTGTIQGPGGPINVQSHGGNGPYNMTNLPNYFAGPATFGQASGYGHLTGPMAQTMFGNRAANQGWQTVAQLAQAQGKTPEQLLAELQGNHRLAALGGATANTPLPPALARNLMRQVGGNPSAVPRPGANPPPGGAPPPGTPPGGTTPPGNMPPWWWQGGGWTPPPYATSGHTYGPPPGTLPNMLAPYFNPQTYYPLNPEPIYQYSPNNPSRPIGVYTPEGWSGQLPTEYANLPQLTREQVFNSNQYAPWEMPGIGLGPYGQLLYQALQGGNP